MTVRTIFGGFLCLLIPTALLPRAVWAQGDAALYTDLAPPGSAFVRLINADASVAGDLQVGDFSLAKVSFCEASPYVFFPPGVKTLQMAGLKLEQDFAADSFYSAVVSKGKIQLLQDTYFKNKRKALVVMYNLLPEQPLSLMANDGKVEVVAAVPAGGHKEREINAVTLQAEVASDAGVLFKPPAQVLSRGNVFSLLVCENQGKPLARWFKVAVESPKQ